MKKTGDRGEDLAVNHLKAKGYTILERNWRGVKGFRSPELDIIARISEVIVFIEVKTASTAKFGPPQFRITPAKQKRIGDGAKAYLAINDLDNCECRFDAIMIDLGIQPPEIYQIENAFMLVDTDIG